MAENACDCCGSVERSANTEERNDPGRSEDRWIDDPSTLDATLPEDVQTALGRFFGTDPVETLGECAARFRDHFDGGVGVDDLCSTDAKTGHRATVDGETYQFRCFYDAVILAALEEEPVDIRTKSPGGEVIEARAVGADDLTAMPPDAVFSFGLDASVAEEDEATLEDGYAAICPYVKAFPDRDAYEQWASETSVPTVGLALAGATEFALALMD